MKLLFASDLHGSATYARKLVDAYAAEGAERLVLLGDLLYHGPRNDLPDGYQPKAVIALLNELAPQIIAVRGNCEAEVDQWVLDFPVHADYSTMFLPELGGRMIFLTHGHRYHADALPPLQRGDLLIHGHTHVPAAEDRGDVIVLNPGSTSLPKAGSGHGYMVYEDRVFTLKTFDGDVVGRLEVPR